MILGWQRPKTMKMSVETAGLQVRRILIEPEAFARWCAEKGVEPDSAARRDYVASKNSEDTP